MFNLWCPRTDSNRGPIDYKSIALPAELQGHIKRTCIIILKIINLKKIMYFNFKNIDKLFLSVIYEN